MLSNVNKINRPSIYKGALQVVQNVASLSKMSEIVFSYLSAELGEEEVNSRSLASNRIFCDDKVRNSVIKKFEKDETAKMLMWQSLRETGMEMKYCFVDRLRLRIVPAGSGRDVVDSLEYASGKYSCNLPEHRDTWGSSIAQQINWWSPIIPITSDRTMNIFPSYFDKPVRNTSQDWDYDKLRKSRKKKQRYPQMPVTLLTEDERNELEKDAFPILINPTDLLAFSGAHLHGSSILEPTSLNRFSIEWRTVDIRDFRNGSGAPMIDAMNPVREGTRKWFTNLETGEKLN
eukprot:g4738.t1